MTLGVSITNLAKVLKLAGNEDRIILRAEEDATSLSICFDNTYAQRLAIIMADGLSTRA